MPATLNAVYANGDFALENGLGTIIDYVIRSGRTGSRLTTATSGCCIPLVRDGACQYGTRPATDARTGISRRERSSAGLSERPGRVSKRFERRATGNWSTTAHATFGVAGLARATGDSAWYLMADTGGQPLFVVTTRLELSWVYSLPGFMGNLDYSTLLRPLFARIDTTSTLSQIVADVAAWCYYGFDKRTTRSREHRTSESTERAEPFRWANTCTPGSTRPSTATTKPGSFRSCSAAWEFRACGSTCGRTATSPRQI